MAITNADTIRHTINTNVVTIGIITKKTTAKTTATTAKATNTIANLAHLFSI